LITGPKGRFGAARKACGGDGQDGGEAEAVWALSSKRLRRRWFVNSGGSGKGRWSPVAVGAVRELGRERKTKKRKGRFGGGGGCWSPSMGWSNGESFEEEATRCREEA
jgi:hypothetical protein